MKEALIVGFLEGHIDGVMSSGISNLQPLLEAPVSIFYLLMGYPCFFWLAFCFQCSQSSNVGQAYETILMNAEFSDERLVLKDV